MGRTETNYRFNLRKWMLILPLSNRKEAINKIIAQSGQSKATIRRIIYMKMADRTFVRMETKEAICNVFSKNISQLERDYVPITQEQEEMSLSK